jgi:hypothetical protein
VVANVGVKGPGNFSGVGVISYPAARHSSASTVLDSPRVIFPLPHDEIRALAGRSGGSQSVLLSYHHGQGSASVRLSLSSRPVAAPQRAQGWLLIFHAVVRHT